MTKSEITFRTATAADAMAYYGGPPPYSFKGFVAELDGETVGIGGVGYQNNMPIAFSEFKETMRPHKKAIAKACRMLTKFFDELRVPVYAVACDTEPTAGYLLAKLGFKPIGLYGPAGETLMREPSWPS